jgi:hypothetical protein
MGFLRLTEFAAGALAMTPRQMLPLDFAQMTVLALGVIVIALQCAPEGYEDETGFHFANRLSVGN